MSLKSKQYAYPTCSALGSFGHGLEDVGLREDDDFVGCPFLLAVDDLEVGVFTCEERSVDVSFIRESHC